MRTKKQFKKTLILIALVVSIILVCQSSAYAVWANNCTVNRMNMNSPSGNTVIQATCGTTDGRVTVSNADAGSNAILAAILTAMSLNTTVNFDLFNAFDSSGQVVRGVQLNNPN